MALSVQGRILSGFAIVLAISAATGGSSIVLDRSISAHIADLRRSLDDKTRASDLDLLTQKTRVRVNQWLRSFNPTFAQQADDLLRQQVAAVQEADSIAPPGQSKETIARIGTALKAYMTSWVIVQKLYAEDAKFYDGNLGPLGSDLNAQMSKVRDAELDREATAAVHQVIEARDLFTDAIARAMTYRTSLKADDASKALQLLDDTSAALDRALPLLQAPGDGGLIRQVSAGLAEWRQAFVQAGKTAQTRVDRITSWTRDEGEVMAQGANALRTAAENETAENDAALLTVITRSQGILLASSAVALFLGVGLSLLVGRSITLPLGRMTRALKALAAGDDDVQVPETNRRDEIGDMAKAAQVFKENAMRTRALEDEKERGRRSSEAERIGRAAEQDAEARTVAEVVDAIGTGLERLALGDLSYRQRVALPSAYETLGRNLNSAFEQLQELVSDIVADSSGIRSSSTEIAQASDNLAQRTEQQAASLEETAAALDEITRMVHKTAEGARKAHDVVTRSKADAVHSGDVVGQAVAAMGNIEESSRRIGEIIGVIDEIAFQTNLLALNAGVEAARAGDAGRGFAVVASEVRALAQRSAEAAKEIKSLISTSAEHVDAGVRLVRETGTSLATIVEQVGEITVLVSGIAVSAREQAAGLDQVNVAVNQMDQVTQQNAAMVEETTAASHSLAEEARHLAQLTDRFQISGSAEAGPRNRSAQDAASDGARPSQRHRAA